MTTVYVCYISGYDGIEVIGPVYDSMSKVEKWIESRQKFYKNGYVSFEKRRLRPTKESK